MSIDDGFGLYHCCEVVTYIVVDLVATNDLKENKKNDNRSHRACDEWHQNMKTTHF